MKSKETEWSWTITTVKYRKERDIHFVVKNDGVYTYFNEMKKFLFNL